VEKVIITDKAKYNDWYICDDNKEE